MMTLSIVSTLVVRTTKLSGKELFTEKFSLKSFQRTATGISSFWFRGFLVGTSKRTEEEKAIMQTYLRQPVSRI